MTALLRRPSAWLPIALSLAALALIAVSAGLGGVAEHEDEGAAARIFQLLMAVDAVAIAFFGLRWVPASPRTAIAILCLQLVLAAVPVATIIVLEA
jgi:hypothetical protein